jgi:glyoxylase-like metal-dependent hydrolase (beta-lactamase superfamily II)
MQPYVIDYANGISAIDVVYVRERVAASHLIVDDGEAAFVDVGTNYSAPLLLATLDEKGLEPEQVRYVCVTHVHLDHAGGAGELMRQLPQATLVVHPRGERHMVDPSKLIAGTIAVYGEDRTQALYGEIQPIPAERVKAVQDEETLELGRRHLRFLDTPGHAYHHYCVVDDDSGSIFSGDTFGLSYRELDTAWGAFILPTTTPIHFDPPAYHASIDRLMAQDPTAIYLTHFGEVTELQRLAGDLHADLGRFVEIAERHEAIDAGAERIAAIGRDMREHLHQRLRDHGSSLSEAAIDAVLHMDIELNAQGLDVWLERRKGS